MEIFKVASKAILERKSTRKSHMLNIAFTGTWQSAGTKGISRWPQRQVYNTEQCLQLHQEWIREALSDSLLLHAIVRLKFYISVSGKYSLKLILRF